MRIVLLANSYKDGGRCLAGLDANGTWVRPVSDPEGGGISVSAATWGGLPLRPLQVIEFEEHERVPLPYQTENILIDEDSIRLVGSITAIDARLAAAAETPAWFMDNGTRSIPATAYEGSAGEVSLSLVRVPQLKVVRRVSGYTGRVQWRAQFPHGDEIRDWPLTDEHFTSDLDGSTDFGDSYLCISIGKELDRDHEHYKLVAGVVPL